MDGRDIEWSGDDFDLEAGLEARGSKFSRTMERSTTRIADRVVCEAAKLLMRTYRQTVYDSKSARPCTSDVRKKCRYYAIRRGLGGAGQVRAGRAESRKRRRSLFLLGPRGEKKLAASKGYCETL